MFNYIVDYTTILNVKYFYLIVLYVVMLNVTNNIRLHRKMIINDIQWHILKWIGLS